jgi:hypothetical protein
VGLVWPAATEGVVASMTAMASRAAALRFVEMVLRGARLPSARDIRFPR